MVSRSLVHPSEVDFRDIWVHNKDNSRISDRSNFSFFYVGVTSVLQV